MLGSRRRGDDETVPLSGSPLHPEVSLAHPQGVEMQEARRPDPLLAPSAGDGMSSAVLSTDANAAGDGSLRLSHALRR